jgi:uncharacterized membrane protein YbhN (UPF0104 family)
MSGTRRKLLLQVAVSVLLLVLLLRRIDLAEGLAALGRLRISTLAAALALSFTAYWGRAGRWWVLLRRAGVRVGGWTSYRLTLVGIFYGMVTPGRIGELGRALHLDAPRSKTIPSVVWDRAIDVILLEMLAVPAFWWESAWRGRVLAVYLALVALTLVAVLVLALPLAGAAVTRVLPRLARPVRQWHETSRGILEPGTLLASLAGGLFFYALNFAGAFLCLRELLPAASPSLALAFPVIPLIGNLPVAFGGLGLREQVTATLFQDFGAQVSLGPIFSLLWFLIMTLIPGLAGLALSRLGRSARAGRVTDRPEPALPSRGDPS